MGRSYARTAPWMVPRPCRVRGRRQPGHRAVEAPGMRRCSARGRRADCLLHEPLHGPHAVPAQGPCLGGQAASGGEGVCVAACGDVLLQEHPQSDGARRVGCAVVRGEVDQAGSGEGAGEVEEVPAVLPDVDARGVELGVRPAERVERRPLDAGVGRSGDPPQSGLDVVAVRPPVGLPQPLEVIEGSAGQGNQARAVEEGQAAGRAGGVEHHGGGDAVEVVGITYGGAEVVHEHPEPLVLHGGGVELGDREPALVGHPQGLGLAVEGLFGVLEDGGGAVGEGDAFDAGHAPDTDLGTFGDGLADKGTQVVEQGGGQALIHGSVSRGWWAPGRANGSARPEAVLGVGVTRPRSRGGRRPARSSPP
ncbi:hypothetical protein STANM309S_06190 [Streptomyces tanashiensis]